MESLTFELSEFQVLEDIEFDETIQRPEQIRFFTLEEQTVDAFERMIPRGRVTKYQLEQIRKKVDRFQELYNQYVVPTAETYKLREPSYSKQLDWIHPIYKSDDLKSYSFAANWMPLYANITIPNFYPRMVSALPRPYTGTQNVERTTEFLDDTGNHPLRALPVFETTRTQVHEDKTVSVVRVPVQGTSDTLDLKGYYLAKREVGVPNPLPDHPFLKGNEPTVLDSTAPLEEILPSLDAILTHAVPVTTDPYGEGMQYLKIYDIQLTDIPWSSWKSRFPQVEAITIMPQPQEIPYPKVEEHKPSEKLESIYKSKYFPGLSARHWLMSQPDGGELVIQMLKSESINNGSVEIMPMSDILPTQYPTTTLDDPSCNLLGTSFSDFVVKGILRRDMKDVYTCVPLEFVKQERAQLGYKNRKPWKETTGSEILKEHLLALKSYFYSEVESKKTPELSVASKEISPLRIQILAIQQDENRLRDDKVKDIQELLKDTFLANQIYKDAEERFVFCAHTLALLSGDLANDRLGFYDKWTSREDGFRVCKFCGEQINSDVLVNQDEFDEDGFKLNHSEALSERVMTTDAIQSFTTGLIALKPLFLLDAAMDSTVYLLLSILQVLPSAGTLQTLLQVGRGFIQEKFGTKKDETAQDREIKGSIGIAIVVLLLQIHIPSLLPRRSFGSQPLKLSGFPRDAEKAEGYTIVDSMLYVLRRTFEAYPTSFKGPASAVIRAIVNNETRKKIKTQIDNLLSKKLLLGRANIRAELDKAAEHVKSQPVVEQPKTLLPVVQPPKELGVITRFPSYPSERAILASAKIPKVIQEEPPLRRGLFFAKRKSIVEPAVSIREKLVNADAKQVAAQLKKKSPIVSIQKGYVTNTMLASHISDVFEKSLSVRNINPTQKSDVLRDVAQGLFLDAVQLDSVNSNKLKQYMNTDVTLYTLTSNYKEQKREVNKLRAKERLTLVQRLSLKNDQEREDLGELLKIGLAPYIITNQDRIFFAEEAEQLQSQLRLDFEREEQLDEEDAEIGVGLPQDLYYDQGEGERGDNGNYGDYTAQPGNDGRDHEQTYYGEDQDMPI
jgi:hypothetical protein